MNRHYEIVLLINADQSEQVPNMVQRYRNLIESNDGKIHRYEDWGRRQLAYPIKKVTKAHYLLMNLECNDTVLAELNHNFRFNDAILRSLVLRRKDAITIPSAVLRAKDKIDKIDKIKKPSIATTSQTEVKEKEAIIEETEDLAISDDFITEGAESESIVGPVDDSTNTDLS